MTISTESGFKPVRFAGYAMIPRYFMLLVALAIVLGGCNCTRTGLGPPDMAACKATCPPGTRAMATMSDNVGIWKCGCVEAPEVQLICRCGDNPSMSVEAK